MADTLEIQRIAAVVSSAIIALETEVLSALSLRPVSGAIALAEVAILLQKLNHLRDSCLAAAHSYDSCEHTVPLKLQDVLDTAVPPVLATAVPVLAAVASQRATVIPGFGRASVFAERKGTFGQVAPMALPDLLARMQSTEHPQALLRVEQVQSSSGGREFLVYVPGTRQMSFVPTNNPFNLTSAVGAIGATGKAASERSVLLALDKAGIGSVKGDTVTLVGYSQGATIAANIASRPQRFNVRGLVSIAGPISARHLPAALNVAALENSTDPVPWLDGSANPASGNQVTAHIKTPTGLNGHDLVGYGIDAERIESSDAGFAAFKRKLQEILQPNQGKAVTGTWYELSQNPWPKF